MKSIDLKGASTRDWDVILVGSSFAACFFAHSLKGRGLSVLFVERGPFVDRDTQLDQRLDPIPSPVRQNNTSGQRKDWVVRHQVGGCSNCWWGNTPRLWPSDFEMQSRFGIAQDWPVGYNDLEPYLVRAEQIMEIAGSDNAGLVPRSAPFPFPAHAPTRAEQQLFDVDPTWQPMPCARSNGGNRATCCGTGSCSLCPVDAKFTILNALDLFDDAEFFLLTNAECRTIETEAGTAKGITARSPDGALHEFSASFVGLAANPISNAAILLRSGLGGDLVGRGLHEQLGQFVWIDVLFDNYYGGTSISGVGYAFYDGDFRRDSASVLIESWNSPPSLRLERDKWLQRLKLKLVAEDVPQPQNRVVLEGNEAVVNWTGHSDYAIAGLERARQLLPDLLPFEVEKIAFGGYEPTEAHIIGGTPMGEGPQTGVVDRTCRMFDVPNVACLGASVFPTGAAANPTLTLSALSLYAGEKL